MNTKNIILPHSPGSKEGAAQFLRELRHADVPQALVQKLGAHDLLLAMEQADDEQRADLLVLSSKSQFNQMVDFSCWEGFEPSLENLEQFISPLVQTGIGGALRAIDKMSDELKTLMFQNRVVVHLREERNEVFPDVPDSSEFIETPDGYYGIEIVDAEHCPDVVKELIRAVTFRPFEFYQRELEAIRHDLKFELMEDALRWRNGRLADLGFGTYEEGLALLAPRSAESVKEAVAQKSVPPGTPLDSPMPMIYQENMKGRTLLDASFEVLANARDEKWQARSMLLQGELSAMVSLFLTGIQTDLADVDAIAKGTALARDILELGLTAVANTPEEGAAVLAYQTPGQILQVGMGYLLPLRERARQLRRDHVLNGVTLDTPWQVVLDCVGSHIPMWWPALDDTFISASVLEPLQEDLVSISSLARVASATAQLDELTAIRQMLVQLKWSAAANDTDSSSFENQPSGLVLTLLCNAYVDGTPTLDALAASDVEKFIPAFLGQRPNEMLVSSLKMLTLCLDVAAEGTLVPAEEPASLRRLLLRLLLVGRDRLESESFSSVIRTM